MSFPIVLLAAVSCLPYYFKYEKKKPQTREHVVLAVMTALTVISRMIFAPVPGFKPVAAMTAVCGMAFGRESGFLCGSLSAFISNFFFGQGPWTPFQMIAWGSIGWFAGILNKDGRMEKHKISAVVFGIAAGIWFSLVMNLWVMTGAGEEIQWIRYGIIWVTSLPVTIEYCVSNVLFLWILIPGFMKRLNRVKYKYGFFDSET